MGKDGNGVDRISRITIFVFSFNFHPLGWKQIEFAQIRIRISRIFSNIFFIFTVSIPRIGSEIAVRIFPERRGEKGEEGIAVRPRGRGDQGGKACGAPGIAVSDKPGFSRGAGPTDSDAVPPALPPRSPLLAWLLPPHYSWPLSLSDPVPTRPPHIVYVPFCVNTRALPGNSRSPFAPSRFTAGDKPGTGTRRLWLQRQ